MTTSSARLLLAQPPARHAVLREALRELRGAVEARLRAARRAGTTLLARVEVPIPGAEAIDPLGFLAAQRAGERRYFRTRDGVSASAMVGNALHAGSLRAEDLARFRAVAPSATALVAQRFDPTAVGAPEWRDFEDACVVLPAVELRRDGATTTLAANLFGDAAPTLAALRRVEGLEQDVDPHAIPSEAERGINSSESAWQVAVEGTLREIERGSVRKIVLARTRSFRLPEPLDPCELLQRLAAAEPGTYQFLIEPREGVAFLGASPERLFRREGSRAFSEAIAGTRPRGETPEADADLASELRESPKDRLEQRLVLEDIRERLAPIASGIRAARAPDILPLARVQHLRSRVEAELREGVGDADLLESLHPTPAVCGLPIARARTVIRACEPFDRGLYAGPVGISGGLDGDGSEFCVAIRSALVSGRSVVAFAGAGIVAGSDPDAEWRETDHKLATFESLVRSA